MVDVYVIGTSGMQPLVDRRLSSVMIKSQGETILIDAGEGTQIGIKESKWTVKSISTILITHLHTDHVLGLAGVLLLINNSMRTEPVTIAGPFGLKSYLESLDVIMPELGFPIYFMEFTEDEESFISGVFEVTAFKVEHSITCYGYSFYYRRLGEFNLEKAKNIPECYWTELSLGHAVKTEEGKILHPDDIAGPERAGIKITYVTDTRAIDSIVQYAAYSDLFICEGMYVGIFEKDEENKVRNYHMTFGEAATLAEKAKVDRLVLTHFSPSIPKPKTFLKCARKIFENTMTAFDGMSIHFDYQSNYLTDRMDEDLKIAVENPLVDYVSFSDRNEKTIAEYRNKLCNVGVKKHGRYGRKRKTGGD